MNKIFKLAIVLFTLTITICAVQPRKACAGEPVTINAHGESYLVVFDRAFKSTDTLITAKFLIVPAVGVTLIPTGSTEHGSAYMPTFVRMVIGAKSYSASASVIDEPVPYLLYNFQDEDYKEIEGMILDVDFFIYGRRIPQ